MPIVCGMAMSHVALTDDAPDDEQFARIRALWERCVERFEQARPDVMIAFLDDHFENFRRPMMPALALGVADEHAGPPVQYESWLGVTRRPIPGHARLAKELLTTLVDQGFDLCRVERVELGHNLVEPLRHFGEAAWSVPVIPIFINVFTPPTPSMARAHDLGAALAMATATWPERVLVIGTGGLSHSPLYWDDGSPDTEFFRRMRRFQDGGLDYLATDPDLFTELGEREIALGKAGVTSINEAWDRELLAALQSGDARYVRALQVDEMTKVAGAGAREALTWAAVMGAMDASVPDIVGYEPVEPWITGVGFAAYPVVSVSAAEAH